ncbi:TonB-dependent receptor (plasmid) [Novosphingobium sp. PP1Y]|nr:TonB-dependent receptor [Novosphingobium sp. PP1Y]
MGDIIVTANRTESRLSKTPVAMTAISQDGLRDAGIVDARSLGQVVPNLQISTDRDNARVAIRGVTSADTTEKGDPSAAFLLDGVYIARSSDILGSFYDLERIEVLRGPQGTLYGRNTTAGVINVISARPKAEFEASGDAYFGNYGQRGATAMINIPVGDSLGLRAAVNYERMDNVIKLADTSGGTLLPARDIFSGRLSFGGTLGDRFKFVVRGDYSNANGSMLNVLPLANAYNTAVAKGVNQPHIRRSTKDYLTYPFALAGPDQRDYKFGGIMGEFSYDFGLFELTYLGSYRETHRDDLRNYIVGSFTSNPAVYRGRFNQRSHELRAAFGQGNPLHGQVGLYYFREKSDLSLILGPPEANGPGGANAIGFGFVQGPTQSTSKGVFGTLTYDVTPELHLTGGVRHTKDEKSRNGLTVTRYPSVALSPCAALQCTLNTNIAANNWSKTTWKVGVDYDSPIGLIFASISTGYKSGGFNDGCLITSGGVGCILTPETLYYQPENLTAYEAGVKLKLGDAVRLNGSVFHYDYSGLQLSQVVTAPVPGNRTSNAAKAKVDGVELEANITPYVGGMFSVGLNYLNARFADFIPDVTFPNTATPLSFAGKQLDHAPKWTANLGYTHTVMLGNDAEIEFGVRSLISSSYVITNLGTLSQFKQPGYSKTDLNITYNAPEKRYYVQLFLKNLENKLSVSQAQGGRLANVQFEQPRTYGVRAGFKF